MDKRIAVASILLAGVTKKMAASRFLMINGLCAVTVGFKEKIRKV